MLLVSLLLASALSAPTASPLVTGECMDFAINYLGMKLGTASISVREPVDSLVPVELEAHTTGVVSNIYDLREKLASHINPESGLPGFFILDSTERGSSHHDTARYDRSAGAAEVVERGKTTSTTSVPIQPETMDFVALVFKLRRIPLEPGARHTFSILAGTKVLSVVAEVIGREKVQTRAGTYPALKIRVPTGLTGQFSERDPTYLWLSDDVQRIVVRISTDFSFGGAIAELISYRPGAKRRR